MATKRFKQSDIVAYLLGGGDISTLSDLGVNQKSLMAAFISSPELVNKFRKQAKTEYEPYADFQSGYEYDPATNINEVESKYYAMPEKYGVFAKNFWDQVKAVGANPTEVGRIKKKIESNRDLYAQESGMTRDEFDELYGSLTKDVENFQLAEAKREKSQYGSFMSQRKKLGITKEGEGALDQYLAAQTGVAGLAEMPTSLEDFAGQKSKQFVKALAKAQNANFSPAAQERYAKQFEAELKKKTGKNYQKFVVRDLLKKNLLGE